MKPVLTIVPVARREESFDEFSRRRWNEMETACRAGRPFPESDLGIDEIVAKIRTEYYGLH